MTRVPPSLRAEVLRRVQPSPERTREARALARDLMARLRAEGRRRRLRIQPTLVGSLEKDTHLTEPLDIDLFVLFPASTPRAKLEKDGVALGRAVLKRPVLRYAEHPYVHGRVRDFLVDIVPAYKLRDASGRLSAVDRTPFHTRYVKRRATARHRAEIRLFKRWLRGVRCYGAETATGGVSGYLGELLVLRYGTFARTVDAMATWTAPVELSLHGEPAAMGGPLVVIDPVDATRNAAAAVTPGTFDRLVRAARAFRREPRLGFFFPTEPKALPKAALLRLLRGQPTVGLVTPPFGGRPETRLPQAQRLLAKLRTALQENGFRIVHQDAFAEDAHVLLLLEHEPAQLPETYAHRGPRAEDLEHLARFREKWVHHPDAVGGPELRDGRWVVTVRRRRRTPSQTLSPRLRELLQGFDFSSRDVASAKLVEGARLAADAPRRLPLTWFLRRLDPWDA